MTNQIRVIVGLGNPGPKYFATRHNAGYWFLQGLQDVKQHSLTQQSKFKALVGQFTHAGEKITAMAPETFMNRSGQAVAPLLRFYKILPSQLLVVHDELDLDAGQARLKTGGGHGGHNGLRDIIASIGSSDFHRLRIGIGRSPHKGATSNYVLNAPNDDERIAIDVAIKHSLDIVPLLLDGDFSAAMNQLHRN